MASMGYDGSYGIYAKLERIVILYAFSYGVQVYAL